MAATSAFVLCGGRVNCGYSSIAWLATINTAAAAIPIPVRPSASLASLCQLVGQALTELVCLCLLWTKFNFLKLCQRESLSHSTEDMRAFSILPSDNSIVPLLHAPGPMTDQFHWLSSRLSSFVVKLPRENDHCLNSAMLIIDHSPCRGNHVCTCR